MFDVTVAFTLPWNAATPVLVVLAVTTLLLSMPARHRA
jgi:hypothetical protein